MASPVERLRALLEGPRLLEAPGCYDAFSARLVERAGFPAVYLSGFGVSASALGLPDVGLLSFAELAERAAAVAAAVDVPVIADADTGYGGPLNVYRTVRALARAGVAAVQLEDQVWPKRCGHTTGKQVAPVAEAVARIRAAVDARRERDVVVIARTDARAVVGLEAALERCRAFAAAGADVLFLEAPESAGELARIAAELDDRPLLVNLVEGGRTPLLSAAQLQELGYRLAIYPLTLLLASAAALTEQLDRRGPDGSFARWSGRDSFAELRELVGFPEAAERERRYRG